MRMRMKEGCRKCNEGTTNAHIYVYNIIDSI